VISEILSLKVFGVELLNDINPDLKEQ